MCKFFLEYLMGKGRGSNHKKLLKSHEKWQNLIPSKSCCCDFFPVSSGDLDESSSHTSARGSTAMSSDLTETFRRGSTVLRE